MEQDASEIARRLAARRKKKTITCPICGKVVEGVGRKKYCSPQCVKKAWWRRHRGKDREGQQP